MSIDLATAAYEIDWRIARFMNGDYRNDPGREQAIEAVAAGRPAILTRGFHHNQFALSACYRVNVSGMSLDDAITRMASEQGRDLNEVRFATIRDLIGGNSAGSDEIEHVEAMLWGLKPERQMRLAAE
jgi:hypothetical protein